MKRSLPYLADALFAAIAFAWPLECLTFVPGVHDYLVPVLATLLIPILLFHSLAVGRLRMPFELAAPWLAALALAVWQTLASHDNATARIALGLITFAALVHFRIPASAQRRYVWLTVVGTLVAAALTLFGWFKGEMPTAYSLATGARLDFAYDISGGAVTLLIGFVLALGVATSSKPHLFARIAAAGAAVVIGAVFATVCAAALPAARNPLPPRFLGGMMPLIGLATILVYGVSRVIAKIEVDREERSGSLHGVYIILLAMVTFALLLLPALPRVGYGFVAGLACACALPGVLNEPIPRYGIVACIVPLALLGLNLHHVDMASSYDGRNYDVALAQDLSNGDTTTLHERLDFIEELSPDEPRAHWWRAQALLAGNRPMRAVTEFAAGLRDSPASILPAPSMENREAFLIKLRDHESSADAPEAEFAYARALVATGRTDEALALLRLQAKRSAMPGSRLPPGPLADAIAFLLDAPDLKERLEGEWSAELLLAVLQNWKADLVLAPNWFSAERLPVVFAGTIGLGTSHTLVAMPGDRDVQEKPFKVDLAPGSVDTSSYWTPVFGDAHKWVVEWILPSQGRGPARITGHDMQWDLLTYEATLAAIPERPALTIWVPPTLAGSS